MGPRTELLDSDVVRATLSKGLGYSRQDREENIRRIAGRCEQLGGEGVIPIVAVSSPYRAGREFARARLQPFVAVHVDCPLAVLVARDTKGLYRRALLGEITNLTGVGDRYDEPLQPELKIDTSREPVSDSGRRIWERLVELEFPRGGEEDLDLPRVPELHYRDGHPAE